MRIDSSRRALVGGVAVAALVRTAALLAAQPEPRVITVVARKFEFVPNEIRLKQGETVRFELHAPEVPMGFSLPDFKLRADVVPGQVTTLDFTPNKTGSFTFLCDVFCGSGHEDMSGTLLVI